MDLHDDDDDDDDDFYDDEREGSDEMDKDDNTFDMSHEEYKSLGKGAGGDLYQMKRFEADGDVPAALRPMKRIGGGHDLKYTASVSSADGDELFSSKMK